MDARTCLENSWKKPRAPGEACSEKPCTNCPRRPSALEEGGWGRGRAWVEQHQGLLGYTAEEALFRTKEGTLRISGANLRFLRYSSSDAIVTGRIDTISVLGGGT